MTLTSPLPRILPLLLSPYVTYPSCLIFKLTNFEASLVICLEQPLSNYHSCWLAVQSPYKIVEVARVGPLLNLGPIFLTVPLGTHFTMPLGK